MDGIDRRIRPPLHEDFSAWLPLYLRYAKLVDSPHTSRRHAEVLWDWLMHGTHRVAAFFAFSGNRMTGFAHYRPFPRTLDGNEACFLDDLFVEEGLRGTGLARDLILRVRDEARSKGWTEVRWVTTPENTAARRLYERLATLSDLLTYRLSS